MPRLTDVSPSWVSSPRVKGMLRGGGLTTVAGGFYQKVLAIQPASLIAYWPLWETTGAVAEDLSPENNDGAYTAVTLGQPGIGDGRFCPLFDGANSYVNIYSAGFAADFSAAAGTVFLWARMANAGVWTDATDRRFVNLETDGNNYIYIGRTVNNNQLTFRYRANAVFSTVDSAAFGGLTTWIPFAITWDTAVLPTGEVKAYGANAQVGVTQVGLGAWVGALNAIRCCIGARLTTPLNVHSGWVAHVAIWTVALSLTEIQSLGNP